MAHSRPVSPMSESKEGIVTLGNHHVFFEGPLGKTLGNVMSELRSWLDTNKIIPSGFL